MINDSDLTSNGSTYRCTAASRTSDETVAYRHSRKRQNQARRKPRTRRPTNVNKQIDIALRICLATSCRAKDADIARPAFGRDAQDLLTLFVDLLDCHRPFRGRFPGDRQFTSPIYYTTHDGWLQEKPCKTSEERLLSPTIMASEDVVVLDASTTLGHLRSHQHPRRRSASGAGVHPQRHRPSKAARRWGCK